MLVFKLCFPFLDLRERFSLVGVSKLSRKLLEDESFQKSQSILILQFFTKEPINEENCFDYFFKLTGLKVKRFSALFRSLKGSVNLLKNPCFNRGLQDWETTIKEHVKWKINEETVFKYRALQASFDWLSIGQTFDLGSRSYDRILSIGTWVTVGSYSGGEIVVDVCIFKDGIEHEILGYHQIIPVENQHFQLIKFNLVLEKDLNFSAKVTFSGKDNIRWKGNFGTIIGYCFAREFLVI